MSGGGTMIAEPGRTITYSLYLPQAAVAGMTFVESFAFLDRWAVDCLREQGVPAGYRRINDIVSPRGKIAGAAQARRRHALLHHTTLAYAMDGDLVPRLIRIGRERLSQKGIRSAEKTVSPLSWFTNASLDEVITALTRSFEAAHRLQPDGVADAELREAEVLVESRYATREWLFRLP